MKKVKLISLLVFLGCGLGMLPNTLASQDLCQNPAAFINSQGIAFSEAPNPDRVDYRNPQQVFEELAKSVWDVRAQNALIEMGLVDRKNFTSPFALTPDEVSKTFAGKEYFDYLAFKSMQWVPLSIPGENNDKANSEESLAEGIEKIEIKSGISMLDNNYDQLLLLEGDKDDIRLRNLLWDEIGRQICYLSVGLMKLRAEERIMKELEKIDEIESERDFFLEEKKSDDKDKPGKKSRRRRRRRKEYEARAHNSIPWQITKVEIREDRTMEDYPEWLGFRRVKLEYNEESKTYTIVYLLRTVSAWDIRKWGPLPGTIGEPRNTNSKLFKLFNNIGPSIQSQLCRAVQDAAEDLPDEIAQVYEKIDCKQLARQPLLD